MTDHPEDRPANSAMGGKLSTRPARPMPRWVKAFIIAAAVLVVAFAVIHLSGGGMMSHTP
ncbi:hypothetical protein GU243_11345 [Pseudarthrobacter psychrotolerans]|uniref:Uncharacterized protein n=1 Tax=Pseudarthrobacter psychrotolerans TaxID=2697569 RepID=A0A6P1NKY0_9MICC|nr:hypothetical protein [Pseudarthrobacter psychrotolerans]QHK20229.1 hypothetical protein GU243_11345 [Pseudarthrobacter psychrotolerans]